MSLSSLLPKPLLPKPLMASLSSTPIVTPKQGHVVKGLSATERKRLYIRSYKIAGNAHGVLGLSVSKSAAKALTETGVPISRGTVLKAAKSIPDGSMMPTTPLRKGRTQRYPPAAETALVELILELRSMKIETSRKVIMSCAVRMIVDTPAEQWFIKRGTGNVVLPGSWYDQFLRRQQSRLMVATGESVEAGRVLWGKSRYLMQHFNILEKLLVDVGVAKANAQYDPTSEAARKDEYNISLQPIILLPDQSHRLLSLDETHVSLDNVDKKGKQIIIGTDEDINSVVFVRNKSSQSATMVGGSDASGNPLPAFSIFTGAGFDIEWTANMPQSTKVDPRTGRGFEAMSTANASGGMTNKMGLEYLDKVLIPFCHDATNDNWYVVTLDGHGSHLTVDFVRACRVNFIHIVLRIPHTTHLTQPEDLVNFGTLKNNLRNAILFKQSAMIIESFDRRRVDGKARIEHQLTFGNSLSELVPVAWANAFSVDKNKYAWRKSGINPFTRKPVLGLYQSEWREAELAKRRQNASHDVVPFDKRSAAFFFPLGESRSLPEPGTVKRTTRVDVRN
jgi:hypothetical protein